MDGVIVDSNPYHKKAWRLFCEQHNIFVTDEYLKTKVFGRTGEEGLANLFTKKIDDVLIAKHIEEIDKNFRDSYAQYIKPMKGLVEFLEKLKKGKIRCAIATSAPALNIELILNKTGLKEYFEVIVDKTRVAKGKPDPEIYLTTAALLKVKPEECIVFEDSLSGISSAENAGMKVISITTTHSADELKHTNLVINDFSELNLSDLEIIAGQPRPVFVK
jgi:HAD superfamily hydrolase (TIGR01509 family)